MIHIIWTGRGYLVLVIAFVSSLAANLITNSVTGDRAYWDTHKWPLAASLLVSAAMTWGLGYWLRNQKVRELIDPKTNEKVVLQKSNTLFFIPLKWWPPILAACAATALSLDVVK